MNLNYLDLRKSITPESMHSVFLGAVNQYTDMILTTTNKPYYVGNPKCLSIIDERLTSTKAPTLLPHSPRSLILRSSWRASEWRA